MLGKDFMQEDLGKLRDRTSFQHGAKCTISLSRSTNAKLAVCPALVCGNSVIKSIDTLCKRNSVIGRGCSKPAGFSLVDLLL